MISSATIHVGDAFETLHTLPDASVQCCVTSPPYWGLRDYGVDGQLGLEETPEKYVENMVRVFREVRRVLRDDGTLWLNLGDSYATSTPSGPQGENGDRASRTFTAEALPARGVGSGLKPKDLCMIPARVAMALQADGWWLRSDIIWHKPNPMPESVTDRPTSAHEHIFLLSKSKRYFYDADAIREPLSCPDAADGSRVFGGKQGTRNAKHGERTNGRTYNSAPNGRNKRNVWTVTTKPFPDAHFAVYPPALIEPCIAAGSAEGDMVLDPFSGAGTTGVVALKKGRDYVGIELNEDYAEMCAKRLRDECGTFFHSIETV